MGSVGTAVKRTGSAPGMTRTCDLAFRKRLLYPAELRGRALNGIHPAANWVVA